MTDITHRFRKAIAAFAVGAFSLVGVAGTALVANAAEGNIDTSQTGSITIHKYQNPTTGTGSLSDGTGVTGTPLAGVEFTVTPVTGIDLSTQAGWEALKTATVDTVALDTAAAKTITTETNGAATLPNLAVGVYKVAETNTTNATANGNPVKVATKADAFLVSVPTNNNGTWIYDVNVYPKNTVITDENKPVKKVDETDKAYFPGDTITWTITQTLPNPGQDTQFSAYKIVDVLPDGVNTVINADVTVTKNGQADSKAMVSVNDPNTVTVEYKGDALTTLKAGDQIVVTIKAVVAEDASNLSNQAEVTVNDATVPTTSDSTDPDNPATTTTFANLTINKVNAQNQPLAGATFVITPVNDLNGTAIDGVTDVKTKEVTTAGDAGNVVQNLATGFYKVTETQAPAGYETPTGDKAVKYIQVVAETGGSLTVENVSADDAGTGLLPNLPLTGAQGAILLTIIGIAIIAIAVGTGLVAVRKNRNN